MWCYKKKVVTSWLIHQKCSRLIGSKFCVLCKMVAFGFSCSFLFFFRMGGSGNMSSIVFYVSDTCCMPLGSFAPFCVQKTSGVVLTGPQQRLVFRHWESVDLLQAWTFCGGWSWTYPNMAKKVLDPDGDLNFHQNPVSCCIHHFPLHLEI